MRKLALSLTALGTILIPASHGAPAWAQNQKSWVASNGIDSATCGARPTPCKTFQFAHNHTNPGGEVSVVDSGDYGMVNISKSISIVAEGVEASILATGNNIGVYIQAGANDVVQLRGLTIDGGGTGRTGISFNEVGAVHVAKCLIKNFAGNLPQQGFGIYFGAQIAGELYVSDTVMINNGSASDGGGILILPVQPVPIKVVLNRIEANNNFSGIKADGGPVQASGSIMNINVRDSVVAGNTTNGIVATASAGRGTVRMTLDRVTAANNGGNVPTSGGVASDGANSTIRITNSTVTGNFNGLRISNGGTLTSFGNNNVIDNSVDGMPSTIAGQR
jgi:hypothetical protein